MIDPVSGDGKGVDRFGMSRWDLFLFLLLGGHLIWVFSHFLPVSVGPDAGGLFVQARLLATELTTSFRPESPLQFLGSHWIETADGDFHSRYPPGLPAVLAILYALGGPRAPFFLNPILATSLVGFTFLAGRKWVGPGMAFWAALSVATLPILNRLALHGDAHVAAAVVLLAGIWLLFLWEEKPTWGRAFSAGLVLGLLPTVRYPEAVAGFGVFLFFAFQPEPKRWVRGLLPAAAGASIPFVLLGIFNSMAYQAPWRTGYGFTNEQTAFGLQFLSENLPTYLGAHFSHGLGIWLLLGTAGGVWMVMRRDDRPRGILFLSIVGSLTLLYSAYYWGAKEEAELTLRYFLASLPVFVLAGVWLVRTLPHKRSSLAVAVVVGLFFFVSSVPGSSDALLEEWLGLARGEAVVETVMEEVPPGSILIARRESQELLDYFGLWRLVDDWMMPGAPSREQSTLVWELSEADRASISDMPTPVQITKAVKARARYVGLTDQALAQVVLQDLRSWAGPESQVYWLGKPQTVNAFSSLAPEGFEVFPMVEVPLPGWGGGAILPPWVPKGPLVLFRLDLGEGAGA